MDPSNNFQNIPEETLDLKRYLFLFLGKWYFIAISIFAGLFAAYLINRYSEQIFSVSTTVLVEGADSRRIGPNTQLLMRELNIMRPQKKIENEIGMLKSYSFARRTIEELPDFLITYVSVGRRGIAESKMYNRSPFIVELDPNFENKTGYPVNVTIINENEYRLEVDDGMGVDRVMKFGEKFSNEFFSFTVKLRNEDFYKRSKHVRKFYFTINNPHTLALSYRNKLGVELNDKNGSILSISSSGFVAQQEVDYLNKLAEIYIRSGVEDKALIANNTILFVDEQLSQLNDSLRKAETILQNFRAGKGIIDLSVEGKAILERLEGLYSERNMLSLQLEYFKYLENYLKAKKNVKELVSPASIGVDDYSLAQTVTQLNNLQLERDALLLSVKPDNIQIIKVDQSIASLTNLLVEKVNGMKEVNAIKIKEIERRVTEQEASLRLLPVTERELVNMERKFNVHEKFFTYLREKRIEAGIAKASNIADNKVIDIAMPEMARVIKPNKRNNLLFGFLFGAIIPLLIIIGFDQLNNSIRDPSQISHKTRVPLVSTIGNNPHDSFLPVYHKPKSSFAESFRALRTNLDFLLGGADKKIVLVSSTISGEGKSFIASNLAISLAMLGKKTALLGLDLRKPKIQNLFGIDNSKGISTYLIGRDALSEIIISSEVSNLYILPAGPIPPNPAELVAGKQLEVMFSEISKEFDYVIVDSPPIAIVTDAVLISKLCDVTLYVMRHRYTSRNVLGLVEELSQSNTVKNMAIVLNDYKKPKGYGYSYGYGYGYNYGYGQDYGYGQNYGYGEGYYSDEDRKDSMLSGLLKYFKNS